MASESNLSAMLEQLLRDGADDQRVDFVLFPILMATVGTLPVAGETDPPPPDHVILINPLTQSAVFLEGEAAQMLIEGGDRSGTPPASKASIKELRTLAADELVADQDCAVCLDEFGDKQAVKEMPCKHQFHGGCVEKWLGMHGSCPVCRFQMLAEERRDGREEQGMGMSMAELLISIAVSASFGGLQGGEAGGERRAAHRVGRVGFPLIRSTR